MANHENTPLVTMNSEKPPLAGPETDDLDETVPKSSPGEFDGIFTENNGERSIDEIPTITSRAGPEGGSDNNPDEVDSGKRSTRFPYTHSEIEIGTQIGDLESIPDVNVYQHKKTLAQGMMDLALFSANANQLRYVLESFNRHPYYYPSLILISISLLFQIAVGIGLIWNSTYNVKDDKEICVANKINNFTVIGIFIVTMVNVFISAFGVATTSPTV